MALRCLAVGPGRDRLSAQCPENRIFVKFRVQKISGVGSEKKNALLMSAFTGIPKQLHGLNPNMHYPGVHVGLIGVDVDASPLPRMVDVPSERLHGQIKCAVPCQDSFYLT